MSEKELEALGIFVPKTRGGIKYLIEDLNTIAKSIQTKRIGGNPYSPAPESDSEIFAVEPPDVEPYGSMW